MKKYILKNVKNLLNLNLKLNERKTIWKTIRERKRNGSDNMTRNNESITKIIERKIEGKTGRGRPTITLMKQIIKSIGKIINKELKLTVVDRCVKCDKWRSISH